MGRCSVCTYSGKQLLGSAHRASPGQLHLHSAIHNSIPPTAVLQLGQSLAGLSSSALESAFMVQVPRPRGQSQGSVQLCSEWSCSLLGLIAEHRNIYILNKYCQRVTKRSRTGRTPKQTDETCDTHCSVTSCSPLWRNCHFWLSLSYLNLCCSMT